MRLNDRNKPITGMLGGVVLRSAASPMYDRSTMDAMVAKGRAMFAPDGTFMPLFAGGADTGNLPEDIAADVARISELTSEELVELESRLIELASTTAEGEVSEDDLATLHEIDAATTTIRERAEELASAETARQAEVEELMGRIAPEEEAAETEVVAEETPAEETPEPEAEEAPAEEPEAVAAAAAEVPAPRRAATVLRLPSAPASAQPQGPESSGPVLLASGEVRGVAAGSRFPTLRSVGDAFATKFEAIRGNRSAGRWDIATLAVEYPTDRQLSQSAEESEGRVQAVLASINQDAIVAAGGLCAPVAVSYDMENISTRARPIRDALVRFGADRGGIRFVRPPILSDVDGAVGVWTEANDTTPGSDGPSEKPCLVITCGDQVEVVVDAITQCLQVGNFQRRTFPENFNTFWALAGSAYDRLAENTLWDRMVDESKAITGNQETLSATRDILGTIDRAAAQYRSRHRMSDSAPLRVIIPAWVRELIRVDLSRQAPGDGTMNISDAQLTEYFRVRNINPTYTLEGRQEFDTPQGNGQLLPWNDTIEFLLFHEGAFLHLDGGTLDFGMEIRDSTLNKTNDVQAFLEGFENVAFRGIESYHVIVDVCPNGAYAAGVATAYLCASGS